MADPTLLPDPEGEVYSIFLAMFKSPPYLQVELPSPAQEKAKETEESE